MISQTKDIKMRFFRYIKASDIGGGVWIPEVGEHCEK